MNDIRDCAKGWVLLPDMIEQHFKRALVAFMRKFGLEHIETKFALIRLIAFAHDEFEARVWIDESADQPGARNAIDVNALPRHPGPALQGSKRASLWIDFCLRCHRLILNQSCF